ncbi:Gallinacin-8-like protein [Aix galericulata]|nr:Gallinacin-8-like protein [Aix galericulata]
MKILFLLFPFFLLFLQGTAGRMQSRCQQDFPFIELPSPITALKDRCPDLAMWKGQNTLGEEDGRERVEDPFGLKVSEDSPTSELLYLVPLHSDMKIIYLFFAVLLLVLQSSLGFSLHLTWSSLEEEEENSKEQGPASAGDRNRKGNTCLGTEPSILVPSSPKCVLRKYCRQTNLIFISRSWQNTRDHLQGLSPITRVAKRGTSSHIKVSAEPPTAMSMTHSPEHDFAEKPSLQQHLNPPPRMGFLLGNEPRRQQAMDDLWKARGGRRHQSQVTLDSAHPTAPGSSVHSHLAQSPHIDSRANVLQQSGLLRRVEDLSER